ncbi:MAG: DEAD/DEAH box helicase, partial [Acidobacteria bacterium]|nr:DEAD/DEAH box helicase [Acidobacteriota bacterium]
MPAPDGFALAEDLRDTFLSYLTSALPIGNHQSQASLGRQFYAQWGSELFAGPFVEALPGYERVGALEDYFGDVRDRDSADYYFAVNMDPGITWADIDHRFPQYRRIRDAIWRPDSDEAGEEELGTFASRFWRRPLYRHQWESFEAVARQARNLIVATATGSGKTECFLIPLLYHLLTEESRIRSTPGIRALLLYPMNALVEDQMHRLRQLLFWINLELITSHRLPRPVTFGRYTGATPISAADRDPNRYVSAEALQGLGELTHRADMQTQPPDILVTNFTMLEYILLRGDDQRLFGRPDLFRFLVLDEVHSYTGTQGMEVALLVRRLKAFLQMRSGGQTRFTAVGTSATLPSGTEAKRQTAAFATTLFDLAF